MCYVVYVLFSFQLSILNITTIFLSLKIFLEPKCAKLCESADKSLNSKSFPKFTVVYQFKYIISDTF